MAAEGLDCLLVTAPENMNYLTGYDGESFYTPQCVGLTLHDGPTLFCRLMDVGIARLSTFLSDGHILAYPEEGLHSGGQHPMAWIAGALRQRGWDGGRIGVEMDAAFFTVRSLEELRAALPAATFSEASLLVNWVRLVKSSREIQYMREAGRISAAGMQAIVDGIRPGVRECDVAAASHAALIAGSEKAGGGGPVGFLMHTGAKTVGPHLNWTDEPYRPGTLTNVELGGVRHRYHASLARSIYLGEPPADLQRVAGAVGEAFDVALDSARPGSECQDVALASRAVLERAGYEKTSRFGYSIGLGYWPGSWVERTANLAIGDRTVLAPEMTFHLIVGLWEREWGFWLSETIRIAEDGRPEQFANFPKGLLRLG
jgi:Xaa-Pro aminopeptidase